MNTWFRKVGMGAVALTLAGVLGGCNNGNGGGLIRLFFGINGSGNCNSVVVDVDLSEAQAIIARDESGAVQCVLNALLDSNGCDISFQELQGGDVLRATISGCTIPAIQNLFSCFFEDVDISELQETSSAQCACQVPGCDPTPPVCISEDPDPTSCEICDNGQDDDGNGLEDCEDPNCENSPACNPTTTTSTTSTSIPDTTSTTDTTTTTSTTTTSTTNPSDLTCLITFRLADDVTLGALQWDTDYSDAPGLFPGSGGNVECASLVEGAVPAFNDVDGEELLRSGLITLTGINGPTNVAQCTMKATNTPQQSDFVITVTEASDTDLEEVIPTPDVIIQSINCEGPEPTTTTTIDVPPSTTTTLNVTTTTGGGGDIVNYNVKFRLDSASAPVGALQFTSNYGTATGEFSGVGAGVICSNLVPGGVPAFNDKDAQRLLTTGVLSLTGFAAPGDIAQCTFIGTAGDPPTPADFPIVLPLDDATDVDGAPITAAISVTVTVIP